MQGAYIRNRKITIYVDRMIITFINCLNVLFLLHASGGRLLFFHYFHNFIADESIFDRVSYSGKDAWPLVVVWM